MGVNFGRILPYSFPEDGNSLPTISRERLFFPSTKSQSKSHLGSNVYFEEKCTLFYQNSSSRFLSKGK